ncbi:MAG: hypothetical protein KIT09_26055 [Bryobacteraceae bacterium]|nr:hypothetical protein [Bryobacteraceae bacterium]
MHRSILLSVLTCALAAQASAQAVITTFAGTDWLFPGDGRPASEAPLGGTFGGLGVTVDAQGNYYIADADNNMVMRVGSNGILDVIGGNGITGHSGDNGLATAAALGFARALAFDPAGDLYVISFLGRVRKISRDGTITTIAGIGEWGYDGDNKPATEAALNDPADIAIDSAGAIYIADTFNNRIRKITNGIITTIAGTGEEGYNGDGIPATSAQLAIPHGIALDSAGNLYIADSGNGRLRVVTPDGTIRTLYTDLYPSAVEVEGNALYLADLITHAVFKVENNRVTVVAGTGEAGYSGDGGPGTDAQLNNPGSIAVDRAGNVYIGDFGNSRIRRVTPNGVIQTAAGNGRFRSAGEGGPATSATLYFPYGSAIDGAGNLYISEPGRNTIRRISSGILTRFAGTGRAGYSGDGGPAISAELNSPAGLAYDAASNSLFVADQFNSRVRRIGPDGLIATVAGNGSFGFTGDGGPAIDARLQLPITVAVANGEIYIADGENKNSPEGERGGRIRKVDASGRITTIAGNGSEVFSGDGGPATRAGLSPSQGIAVDNVGNVYVSDTKNHRVRMIDYTGVITTVAGTGVAGNTGDNGPAVSATLNEPMGLGFDRAGNLLIVDNQNHRVRALNFTNGRIVGIAGTGTRGYSGDGDLAVRATLRGPTSLAVNSIGDVLVADQSNHRIRQVKATQPAFRIEPAQLTFKGNSRATAPPSQTVRLFAGVPNVPFSAAAQTETGGNWLSVTPTAGAMPISVEVTANPEQLTFGTYHGLVRFSAPLANPQVIAIPVEFQVEPALPGALAAQPTALTFSFTEGDGPASQTITVTNPGSGSKPFQTQAVTASGGNWLSASPTSGAADATTTGLPVEIRVDPANLTVGTYLGSILLITQGQTEVTIPVTVTVNAVSQRMVVSPVGLSFVGVQNGGTPLPQTFNIVNSGSGNMTWTAQVTDISGGTQWLAVSPESGSADAAFVGSRVQARVNTAGLAPGDYYAQIEIRSPQAVNSPQFVSVFLGILDPGSDPGPVVQPTGLVFRSTQNGSPGSQEIRVSNVGSRPVTFRASRAITGNREWFIYLPGDATVTPDQPARIVIQPQTEGLPPGVYEGSLTLLFTDNTSRTINLLLVNSPSPASSFVGRAADGCTPTKLLPIFTSIGLQSAVLAGWPNPLVAEVVDDCGEPLKEGSVVSEFSNNDPPVLLTSSNDGRWSGIWQIRSTGAPEVTVRVKAQKPDVNLEGTAQVTAAMRHSGDVPPVIAEGGIVSAASFKPQQPLAPGGFISIFGGRLADTLAVSDKVPFETELANTTVSIAGRRMPLHFTSDGQINAIVPYGIAPNTTHQIVVKRGSRIATPEPVTVSTAQPAIFTKNDPDQGAIVNVQGDLVDAAHPVHAGEAVLIFCTGLGPVDPPAAAGSAAPSAEPFPRTTVPVSVTIGGRPATLLYAGLAPGFAGLYQVNALVPEGVTPGNRVPVIVKAGDQESPPVTIAVQ